MNIKRLSRILVCLVMVLSLLVTLSPLKAHATLVGTLPVAVPVAAPLVLGAVIIGLGIMCATDAGVFDGVIAKCQEALASSGLINDGKMDVISVNDKAYIPQKTVEAVRSALFSTTVLYEGLDRVASIKAGSSFTSNDYGDVTILQDCYAFMYWYASLSTPRLVLIPYNYNSSASGLASCTSGSFSDTYVSVSGFGYVHYLAISARSDFLHPFYLNSISNSTNVGKAIASFFQGEFDFSPKTTVLTDYAVALGNVVPDDEDLQTGYPGWYNNAVVIEGTGGSGGTPSDEDNYIALPIEVPGSSSDLEDMTQDEVQDGGELVVETPGGTTSGSGISETWLGQKLDALGDWLSGIKESIIELPSKFATWFGDLITGIESLGETITNAWDAAIEAILNGIRDIFVPSADFLTAKVDALRSEFSFADSIITSGEYIGNSLQGLGTEPPVIYINLANNRGPYDLGGEVAFLDLRWYAEYKPVGDAIISAFLWLLFVWRLYVKAPGIIRGLPGDIEAVKDFRDNGGK